MENNQNSEAYIAGFRAGFRHGKQYMANALKYMNETLDGVIDDFAKTSFRKYEESEKSDFASSTQERDKRFRDWAREALGWDLDAANIPAGILKSIAPMRAYFEGDRFYIDDKRQEKGVHADEIRAMLQDMEIIRQSGLSCMLQDFGTKNIRIEDDEGHVFCWYPSRKTLCLERGVKETGGKMYFRSRALLEEDDPPEDAKCTLRADEIAAYINRDKVKDKIRWMWDHRPDVMKKEKSK